MVCNVSTVPYDHTNKGVIEMSREEDIKKILKQNDFQDYQAKLASHASACNICHHLQRCLADIARAIGEHMKETEI